MRGLAIVFAGCVALVVTTAAAQDDSKALAKAAFAEGKTLFDGGQYAEAAAEFRRAYRMRPNWKVLYNIGQCEALSKRHGLALEAFESYLSEGGDDVREARREEVLAEVERLRKMVGAVEVQAPDGAVVTVDALERGRAPLPGPMMVAAGVSHHVKIKLGDDLLVDRQVRVSGGQTVEVTAEAPAALEPETPLGSEESDVEVLEDDDEAGSGLATAGWVTLGLGGALLIGGSVTGSVTLSLNKDLKDGCPGGNCPRDYWDKNDRMKAMAITTDVLIGVGAAAAATGIILLIVSATGDEDAETEELAIVPAWGPGFAGAGVQGRF